MILLQFGLLLLLPFIFAIFTRILLWTQRVQLVSAWVEESPFKFFTPIAALSFVQPLWTQRILESFLGLRFELGKFRPVMFALCSASLGYLFTLLLPLMFGNVNPIWLMGMAFPIYVLGFLWHRMFKASVLAFATALLIFGFEIASRSFSGINMILVESNAVWILTDGRWLGCMILFLLSVLVTFGLRIPYLVFWSVLLLFLMQLVSLNGFVFAIAGELFGGMLMVMWKMRGLHGKIARIKMEWFLVSTVGLIGGLSLAAFFRSAGMGDLQTFSEAFGRYDECITLFLCLPAGILFANLIWGHFSFSRFSKDFAGTGFIAFKSWDRLIFAGPSASFISAMNDQSDRWEKAESSSQDLDPAMIPVRLRDRLSGGLKDLKLQIENVRTFLQG